MHILTYKYKAFKPKTGAGKKLKRLIVAAWEIYNFCISMYIAYYWLYGKKLSKNDLQKYLAKKKKRKKYSHWCELNSQAIQDVTDRIEKGYSLFFDKVTRRPPKKKAFRKMKSITFKQTGYGIIRPLDENGEPGKYLYVVINSVGVKLKVKLTRPLAGRIRTVTVKTDSCGDWWVAFSLEQDEYVLPKKGRIAMTGKSAGIDFGMKTFLASSDGDFYESPLPLRKNLARKKSIQKTLSRRSTLYKFRKGIRHVTDRQERKRLEEEFSRQRKKEVRQRGIDRKAGRTVKPKESKRYYHARKQRLCCNVS